MTASRPARGRRPSAVSPASQAADQAIAGGEAIGSVRRVALLVLFVAVGANLRTILLAVPPLLPLIQRDLGLSHTSVGLVTAIPILVMGLGAWPAGALMARFGGRAAAAAGLLVTGVGAMLRASGSGALPLYAFTVVLSLGIALAQTSIVALVRLWFPARIGLASAMFTDGVISGEALAAGLTIPALVTWLGGANWRGVLVLWGIPVLAVLVAWLAVAPPGRAQRGGRAPSGGRTASGEGDFAGRRLWLLALHLGLVSGCSSLIYFTMNTWTAPYNAALHQEHLSAVSLALLNAAQLPVSLSLTPVAQRLTGRRLPFILAGGACLLAIAAWLLLPAATQPICAVLFGGATVTVLTLGLALPPYFATPATVARLVGGALSVSYLLSFGGQLLGGALWDLTGRPGAAFLPVIAAAPGLMLLAAVLPRRPPAAPGLPLQATPATE